MNVGKSIRKRREALGLLQADVACAAGISQAMLCQIERGTKNPSLQVSMAIAKKLNCRVEDFCREQQFGSEKSRDARQAGSENT